jgi:hypothetical protein
MAQTVSLIHPQQTLQVSAKLLVQKCDLFGDDPTLTTFPYEVRSQVSLTDFRAFISALEGKTVTINNGNIRGLARLCEELHFRELAAQVSQFRESEEFKEEGTLKDFEARKRLAALEERIQRRDCEIAALRTELSQQQHNQEAVLGRVARLEADVLALHTAPALPHSTVPTQRSPPPSIVPSASVAPAVPTSPLATPPSGSVPQAIASTRPRPKQKSSGPIPSLPQKQNAFLPRSPTAPTSPPAIPPSGSVAQAVVPIASGLNSAIVRDFPELFEDFEKKQFAVLWRGCRNGFRAYDFHRRCDGHENTPTLVLDTKGNIFGGFTPVEWDC